MVNDVAAIIFPEYFVIANYGPTAANLGGYYLTDDVIASSYPRID